jgi:hypothetical protein
MSPLPVCKGKRHWHATRTNYTLLKIVTSPGNCISTVKIVASPGNCISTIFWQSQHRKHYCLLTLQTLILYESHNVPKKRYQHGFDLDLSNEMFWALVMTLRATGCSNNLFLGYTMQSWELGLCWQVWIKSWHDVSFCCFCCSSITLCLLIDVQFISHSESQSDDLMSPFHGHLSLCLHFKKLKDM